MGAGCSEVCDPLKANGLDRQVLHAGNAQSSSARVSCLHPTHVEALIAGLPQEILAQLEGQEFKARCDATFAQLDVSRNGFIDGDELTQAVRLALPEHVLTQRLHKQDVTELVLAFDEDIDGRISREEFANFCAWVVAMQLHGFFSGTAPLKQIAHIGSDVKRLLIVSEFLDPDFTLSKCVLPDVRCVYYHPDGLTLDEFSAQVESAAYIRRRTCCPFKSVALANHGPDEQGLWHVCADQPVQLSSTDEAWHRLLPMFHALADMVASPEGDGNVDFLACDFAASTGGRESIAMIDRKVGGAKFSASTDATGNVAQGGNWELEIGGRNIAPIYFDEHRLVEFEKLMKAKKRTDPASSDFSLKASKDYTFKGEIGIVCDEDGVVQEVIDNEPAHKMGIRKGDKIVKVDTDPFSKEALDFAAKEGSDYSVTVRPDRRPNWTPIDPDKIKQKTLGTHHMATRADKAIQRFADGAQKQLKDMEASNAVYLEDLENAEAFLKSTANTAWASVERSHQLVEKGVDSIDPYNFGEAKDAKERSKPRALGTKADERIKPRSRFRRGSQNK